MILCLCTEEPGVYEAVVPVVISEQWDKPYQMLYIRGQLQEPKIWFDPPGICMTPVPLLTDIHCEFNVLASQYTEWVCCALSLVGDGGRLLSRVGVGGG